MVVMALPLVLCVKAIAHHLELSQAEVLHLTYHIVEIRFSRKAIVDRLTVSNDSHMSIWSSGN